MSFRNLSRCCLATIIVMGLLPGTSLAHHSFAMFDRSKALHIKGMVRRVEWRNPHVYFYIETRSVLYTLESSSINVLTSSGWKPKTVKVADTIQVEFFPFRDGRTGGLLERVTLADGKVLGTNGPDKPGTSP